MEINHNRNQENWKREAGYTQIEDKIYYRIINRNHNAAPLGTALHMDILDMSMVFFILLKRDEKNYTSVAVSREMADYWGVTAEEIKEQAEKNTPLLFPMKICRLNDMVAELYRMNGNGAMAEKLQSCQQEKMQPYVLTNTYGIHGFSAVFYKGILKKAAGYIGSSFFILPSSTHEALLVPENDIWNPDELRQMVHEVNRAYVKGEDFLSDNIYYYDSETDTLQIEEQAEIIERTVYLGLPDTGY